MIKNKKTPYLILTLLIIGTLLLVSVGLSIWLITDNVEIKPEFDKDIIVEYLSSKETTYNGNIQLPLAEALNIDEDITEYRYKLVGEETYQVVDRDDSDGTLSGPINAGDYLLEVVYVQYTYEDESGNKVDSTVTVSGIDFKIKPRSLTDEDVSASFTDNNFYYSGIEIEEITTSLNVKYKGKDLVKGTDYTVVFSETVEIGNNHTATITAVDNSNFTDSIEVKYNILPASLELVISDDAPTVVVNGITYYVFEFGKYNNDNFPMHEWINVQTTQGLAVENSTISYYYYKGLNGTYGQNQLDLSTTILDIGYYSFKITASASGFTSAEKEIKVQIKKLDISSAIVTISQSFMYDGTAHTPEIDSIVCSNGTVVNLNELTAGAVSYSNNIDATSEIIKAKAYIEGSGNYEGTATGEFTITTRPGYIDGNLSFTFITPTVCSKSMFVEGEDISQFITGDPSAELGDVTLSGIIIPILTYPENSKNPTELVSIKYRYIPSKNSNGVYNVEEAETTSSMSVTLYAASYNSVSGVYYGTLKKGIDNATSTNNKVWVVPYDYSTVGYYPTLSEKATIKNGITFGLAIKIVDGVVTEYKVFDDGSDYAAKDSANNPSKAIINEGVTLTIANGASLIIGGHVGPDGAVESPTILMNNGDIKLESGAIAYSYGFTKGTGKFTAEQGSIIYDVIRLYDFPGARYAAGMYFKTYQLGDNPTPGADTLNNILPFQSYSLHNIACTLVVEVGAEMYARAQLNVSNTIYTQNVKLFGSGGLFELSLSEGSSENYVERTVVNTIGTKNIQTDWTCTNQDVYQKEKYDFHASVKDNTITMKLKILIVDLTFKTDAYTAMPVGMMDITIKPGHTLTIQKNSWKILPGASLYIDEGAKLVINSGYNIIFYEEYYDDFTQINDSGTAISPSSFSYYKKHSSLYDSNKLVKSEYIPKLYVDGVVESNGGLAGIIETPNGLGKVILTNASATLKKLVSIKYLDTTTAGKASYSRQNFGGVSTTDTLNPKMRLYNGTKVNENYSYVAAGEYNGKVDDNNQCGWYSSKVSIEYNLNGGSGDTPESLTSLPATGGYLVTAEDVAKMNPAPTKNAYTYGAVREVEINGEMVEGTYYWALDPNGEQIVIPGQTRLYASAIFYAVWVPTDYDITYVNVYYGSNSTDDNFVENPNPSSYNINSVITFANATVLDENGNNLIPGGFFTDIECKEEDRITNIINSYGDITIYVYWYPADSETFTVNYNVAFDSVEEIELLEPDDEIAVIIGDQIKWVPKDLGTMINKDPQKPGYFTQWYFEESCEAGTEYINSYDAVKNYIGNNKVLNLYTKIKPKLIIEYASAPNGFSYSNNSEILSYYATPGSNIILASGGVTNPEKFTGNEVTYYIFNNFSVTSHSSTYTSGATVTLDQTYPDNKVIITPLVTTETYYKLTITNSNTTMTITVDNGTIKNENGETLSSTINDASGTYYGKKGSSFTFTVSANEGYEKPTVSPPSPITNLSAATNINGSAEKSCIAAGTLITLADGTLKPVEELLPEDLLLVFNHETGRYEAANIIFVDDDGWKDYRILNLMFSDGYYVKVIYSHGFFDLDLNKYVYIDESNYNEFIGHRFVVTDVIDGKYIEKEVKLEEVYIEIEYTGCYSPVTVYHLNYFTNGLLSMPAGIEGLFNIFEYGEGMKYDEELMEADIEKYGLYTYDDFKDYIPYEIYAAFPAPYLKVAVGKGLITFEEILGLIDKYLGKMLDYK